MAVIESIRIQNLRSLVDTGWIEQKPITILVGKNSAGKSTLARVFPLLKQSVSERKQSPILWFGQYVDFGQYSVAVHHKTPSASISFSFKIKLSPGEIERRNPAFYSRTKAGENSEFITADAEISLAKGGESSASDTVAERLSISMLDFDIIVKFQKQSVLSFVVGGQEIWRQKDGFFSHVTFDSALPRFSFYKETQISIEEQQELGTRIVLEEFDIFSKPLFLEIRSHVHGNVGDDKVRQIASRLSVAEGAQLLKSAFVAGSEHRTWTDYIASLTVGSGGFKKLQRAILCARLPEILRLIDATISANFNGVRYIEPLRATAQRYYRKQDLAIGELDAKGANVAQFLQSLSVSRRLEFEAMSRRLFGFSVKPKAQGGHIELVLEQTKGGNSVNMADAGVGFSQMLPILLQFWYVDRARADGKRVTSGSTTTLVVEQPELHLHPAYQATLADLFCETATTKDSLQTRIIAETHSPALVNRLGALIADGKFLAKDVQILLFEQDAKDGDTKITKAIFDNDGVLSNWPYGFFEPET